MTHLRVQLLDGFAIVLDGVDLLPGRPNSRLALLLAYLLLKRDRRHSRDHLAYLFWADSSEAQARTNLRTLLAALRKQVPALATYLHDQDSYLAWRVDLTQHTDVAQFEQALHEAARTALTDPAATIAALETAVALYKGELLPNYYEEWVLAERQRLHAAYLDAMIWLIELLERNGRSREAILHAEALLRADALRESSYLLLMRLYMAVGDRARALALYAGCARTLVEELGVEPGPAIEELHRQLLQGMPEARISGSKSGPTLVGRAAEWQQLLGSWQLAGEGQPQIVLLTGEAGIGKSRLAEEFVAWCEAHGAVALCTNCPQTQEPLGLVAVANWLISDRLARRLDSLPREELALLIALAPGLRRRYADITPADLGGGGTQMLRLYQAIAALFANTDEATLLFLDDAQWCDPRSVEWIQYLLAANPQARVMILIARRSDELEGSWLTLARTDLMAKGRLKQIWLGPLSQPETGQLARQIASQQLRDEWIEHVCANSDGTPFFIVETVRLLDSLPESTIHAGGMPLLATLRLPETITAMVMHRVALLSTGARQMLKIAAIVGKQFDVRVVASIDTVDERMCVEAIEELAWRGLIGHVAGCVFEFRHAIVRTVVYHTVSDVRRRYLHQRAAAAMLEVCANEVAVMAEQIAEHYEQAGLIQEALQFRNGH